MRKRTGIAVMLLMLLGIISLVSEAFKLMTEPSTPKVWIGVVINLIIIVFSPMLFKTVAHWSFKEKEKGKNETHNAA